MSSSKRRARARAHEPLATLVVVSRDAHGTVRRLNLPDPASAGVAPGQESVLFNWLLPMQPPKSAISAA